MLEEAAEKTDPKLMAKKLESPTSLTEFAPLSSEVKPHGSRFSFSRLMKWNKNAKQELPAHPEMPPTTLDSDPGRLNPKIQLASASSSAVSSPTCSTNTSREPSENSVSMDQWSSINTKIDSEDQEQLAPDQDIDLPYTRTVPSVLRRIANILDRKGGQTCKESDFKQYWMPDSNCKECYECGSKFTTLRRRHHCRICGQIFCSNCCRQEISGKVMGFSGSLRVCSYCFDIVKSLNAGTEPSHDLQAIQNDLQQKLNLLNSQQETSAVPEGGSWASMHRKSSMGFREEDLARAKPTQRNEIDLGSEYGPRGSLSPEKTALSQDSLALHELWSQIQSSGSGIEFQNHRCGLQTHSNSIVGSELVDWLVVQGRASSRSSAIALGQALVDAKYLERVLSQDQTFVDNFALFRPGERASLPTPPLLPIVETLNSSGSQDGQEPLWVKEIQTADSVSSSYLDTDDSADAANPSCDSTASKGHSPGHCKLKTSASTFHLDLNIKDSCVRVSKPTKSVGGWQKRNSVDSTDSALQIDDADEIDTGSINQRPQSSTSNTYDMVKGAIPVENPDEQQILPRTWHNSQHLKEGSEEKLAYDRMNSAFDTLEQTLLTQLLSSESLSLSWADVIIPLVHRVTDMVRPDVKYDSDDMDIRQYVQIKKIPGGSKGESCIINGVVCTKNVAHKKMKQNLVNPTILLLSSSIVYQRVEKKFSSLDPILMQENEYLKNVVAKLSVYKPDLLLVEKTVSRVAQEMLLDLDITLALNVKPSVMERVARCTQAGIVSSIDAQLGKPHLGVCHHFSVQTFSLPNNKSKTLMFFDGCASHLGCTILLRGGSASELSKVKAICQFMVYVTYNWRLERSFLMDEFSLPPPHMVELPLIMDPDSVENVSDTIADQVAKLKEKECVEKRPSHFDHCGADVVSDTGGQETKSTTDMTSSEPASGAIENVNKMDDLIKATNNDDSTEAGSIEVMNRKNNQNSQVAPKPKGVDTVDEAGKRLESTCVEDFSDPLHSYLQSGDDSIFHTSGSELQVESLPFGNRFRKALDDIVLCCSPFIKMPLPYLETESGRNCKSRTFFPNDIYWSEQFSHEKAPVAKRNSQNMEAEESPVFSIHLPTLPDSVEILPWHPFTFESITSAVQFSLDIQSQLSDFRARGGRIRPRCPHELLELAKERERKSGKGQQHSSGSAVKTELQTPMGTSLEKKDALNPYNHQHLVVLFCSYSSDSSNAPNFCVSPWVVNMDFYGQNDIPLGGFLERYCFRPTYICPSSNCDTPMTEHIRKFAHDNGCISIILRKVDNLIPAAQNNILMWSWCNRCEQSTPCVPMSDDTWSLSFAKYLELRFHGGQYTRRGAEDCPHSLHHEHYQFFAHKQVVALFRYNMITMREVVWPALIIDIKDDPIPLSSIIEEIKFLAIRGYGVYSEILERLCTLKSECTGTKYEDFVGNLIEEIKMETTLFRVKIEEIQLQLTSPTLETCRDSISDNKESPNVKGACVMMWKILDRVTLLKRQIAEAVYVWNNRIQDFVSLRKKEDKVAKLGGSSSKASLGGTPTSQASKLESSFKMLDDNFPNKSFEKQDLDIVQNSSDSGVVDSSASATPAPPDNEDVTEDDSNLQENDAEAPPAGISNADIMGDESSVMAASATNVADEAAREKIFRRSISVDSLRLHLTPTCGPIAAGKKTATTEGLAENGKTGIPPTPEEEETVDACQEEEPTTHGTENEEMLSAPHILKNEENRTRHPSSGSAASYGSGSQCLDSVDSSEMTRLAKDYNHPETKLTESGHHELETNIYLKGHGRSRSDGSDRILSSKLLKLSGAIRTDEDGFLERSRQDKKDKSTVKTLISQLLSGSANLTISSPFPATDHFLFPYGEKQIPIMVRDQDPGSIIAYALTSPEYEQQLQDLKFTISALTASGREARDASQNSPTLKRKQVLKGQDSYSGSTDDPDTVNDNSPMDLNNLTLGQEGEKASSKQGSKSPNYNIEVQFSDPTSQFYCRVYFAEHFRKIRRLVFPEGEERYIRSLAHCVPWLARGGKSGSSFSKTHDDRFILKQMSKPEIQYFLQNFAPYYFQYISKAGTEQRVTVLTKIVGVYCIVYKNSATNTASKMDLLVMENLFYGRNISQKFDLKGSIRNRLVNTSGQQEGDIVLLDENLIKMTCDCPLYIRPHSKTILTNAINNDTQFLASQSVMDYSLLVGVDDEKKELVVGIIDYVRTFTWDKKLECVVKAAGILGGHGKMPTVVSPDLYRLRFCEAMDRYFLWVPDRWNGLGEGIDC